MIGLVLLGVFLVSVVLCIVFYGQFTKQVQRDLQQRTQMFQNNGAENALLNLQEVKADDMRITIISQEGKVMFDNTTSSEDMTSHLDREEIEEALNLGEGESHRFSETMGFQTYYYAIKLSDGTILRTSKTINSIWKMYAGILPMTIIAVAIVLIIGYFLSNWSAKKVVAPIDKTLTKQRSQIEQSNEQVENMRKEFSANVSHELRTPLTSIYGNAEMLEAGLVKESDKPLLYEKIKHEVSRLIVLIEDIMMISKLDESKTAEASETVNLWEVATECKEALEQKAVLHQVNISVSGNETISANRSLMYEMFYNLIDNAIKYNGPDGEVEVNLAKNNDKIVITVADTGIGIPKDEQGRVFERFYRVDKSRSKETGGTGLGLAIVKHIVIIYGGTIDVVSAINKGTSFEIKLAPR